MSEDVVLKGEGPVLDNLDWIEKPYRRWGTTPLRGVCWVMEPIFGMDLIVCPCFYILGLDLILLYKGLSSHLNM